MNDDNKEKLSRMFRIAIPVVVVAGIAGSIWYMMHDTAGMKREAPPLPTILATLPPPPPPPPPKEKPPEPEKKVEEIRKPEAQPKTDSPPKQMTINGPAQAGNDAFNMGAGDGSGSVGSGAVDGLGNASYSHYLGSTLQQAIQQDSRINRLVFAAELDIWVIEDGRVRAKLVRPTGDEKVDQILLADCENLSLRDEAPPTTLQFPARVAVQGRRPGSQT